MNNSGTLNNDAALSNLESRVYKVFKREKSFLSMRNFIIASLAFAVFLFAIVVMESVFSFSSKVRTVLFYVYLLSLLSTFSFIAISYLLSANKNKFDPVKYSFRVGAFFPAVKDKIANAISLYNARGKNAGTSEDLIDANLRKVYGDTSAIDLNAYINYDTLRKPFVAAVVVLAFIAISIIFVSPFSKAFNRFVNFNKESNSNILISDKNKELNDSFIKSFSVTVFYPDYSKLEPKTLERNRGDVVCLEGSKLKFKIESVEKLSSGEIEFNGNKYPLNINEYIAEGNLPVDKDGEYRFILKSEAGKENLNRQTYSVKILKNEAPKISIVQPADVNFNVYGEKEVLLRAIISDDYGFSKLSLSYKSINGISSAGENFTSVIIPLQNLDATSLEVSYQWFIQSIGLRQNSQVEYFMEVTDNAGLSSKSDVRRLVYNSQADVLKKTESATKEIKAELKTLLDDSKNIQKNINELKRSQEENAVNEQRKKDLKEKVDNMQKNLEDAQNKINQTMNEMKENPNISDKTLEQFMKLQELFNKINTPEFREMLKKLQDAMKKNNDQMKQDLNNIKFDEEAFRKQLEQVMELMKKIENLQKMGELTQKLDEMTQNQEQLKKETEQTEKNNESKMNTLADKQKQIKEDFNQFKQDMKDLIDKMKDTKGEMDPKELQDLLKKMQDKKTEDKMQKSSSDLFKQQKEQSEQTQKDISEDMKEFNEDMQNSLEKTMSNMDAQKKMMDKMQQIKKNLEELSEKEQDIKDETGKLDKSEKKEFDDMAKEQEGVKQRLSKEINDLMNMTKDGMEMSPELGKELGNSYNKMDKASNDLKQTDKNNAMSNEGKAKESLDNAAKMLGEMLDKMGKQQGKGSKGDGKMGQLMQKLAQLIGQQQGVNGKMDKMGQNGKTGRDGKGGKEEMSQVQKEQMDRLRLEQTQIQKSLEELNDEFEKEKQRTGEKILGDMKEVQKDMQESIRQMSEYEVDTKLLERQNRIISRMLDAQLSQREKDFEQKRESKPGTNVSRQSPKEVIISGPRTVNSLKEDLLRLEKESFTEDYEALIIEYNKIINK
jgi:chromosome segregation ATPase